MNKASPGVEALRTAGGTIEQLAATAGASRVAYLEQVHAGRI